MKKLIFALLIGSLLLLSLCACNQSNNNESTTPENTTESVSPDATTPEGTTSASTPDETTTPDNNQDDQPQAEGELDKDSDLIVALVDYLKEYWVECDMPSKSLADKIDDIKNGKQPLHVAFDSENYYYVCGYYNGSHEREDKNWCCPEEYTWKQYDAETEIQEYYNGMKCVVVFQMNEAQTVTNILSNESKAPDMEHFQIFAPTFASGANTATAIAFEDEFIFLNDEDKDTVYHCSRAYKHELVTMSSICMDGQYYVLHFLEGVLPGEEFDLQEFLGGESTTYEFGDYYDAIMSVMDTERYRVTKENGKVSYYGVISFEDFADIVLGNYRAEGELDKDSDLVVTLVAYLDEFWIEYEIGEKTLANRINDIKNGAQPLHVAFDPDNYYYVCGYYNGLHEYEDFEWCCPEEYTWKQYDAETEIQEYYNGMKCVVVFQMNKALTVTNILSNEIKTPDIEHFQMLHKPTFENGVNTKAPILYDEDFVLLNDEDKDVVYYTQKTDFHPLKTMSFVFLDDQYYICIMLAILSGEEEFDLQQALSRESTVYDFGEYYDAIVAVMDADKYTATSTDGKYVYRYGLISSDDFADIVLGNYRAEGELDKDSQIIRTLTQYLIWYGVEGERLTSDFPSQIDHIKEGRQAVHAVFDPSEYYFVCGYYNPTHEYEERNYCCVGSYTWIKYESETEIQEYYNGMKCVVAFQLNESLTVTDILSADADVPHMEYFQLYEPTFKDETNTEAPIIFDGTFIYINGFEKDAVYYCISDYYNAMSLYYREHMLIPCEYIEGQYYIPIQLISLAPDEIFNLQDVLSDSRFEKAFGEYYDAIIKAINTEKWYEFSTSNEKIHYYGLISIDDFVNSVVK